MTKMAMPNSPRRGLRRFLRRGKGLLAVGILAAIPALAPAATPVAPDSVCGRDDRRPVACYDGAVRELSERVARLSIGGESCTGWLLACAEALVTNAHCFPTPESVSAATALFFDEAPTCAGGAAAPLAVPVRELVLLDPETATSPSSGSNRPPPFRLSEGSRLEPRPPSGGDEIWIPQHPSGGAKEVAIDDDRSPTGRCRLDPIDDAGTISYDCDTSYGSSGAPVLSTTTNRVVGLHHAGTAGGTCDDARNRAIRSDRLLELLAAHGLACQPACEVPPLRPRFRCFPAATGSASPGLRSRRRLSTGSADR